MILIVDMCYKKDSLMQAEFVAPIRDIAENFDKCRIVHYSLVSQKELDEAKKVILSGTALKDDEFLKDAKSFEWLKKYAKPVLGICAGMEILCAVFGSKVRKCTEIGMTDVETVAENALFSGKFRAYELHRNAPEPSRAFEVLARSKKCVQAVKHKEKDAYGVMFHPEARNKDIIRQFVIGKKSGD